MHLDYPHFIVKQTETEHWPQGTQLENDGQVQTQEVWMLSVQSALLLTLTNLIKMAQFSQKTRLRFIFL